MRLDKFICESTELTRSMAKKAMKQGEVTCNGEIVKDASYKVIEGIEVTLYGNPISVIGERYIMVHKPQDMICSTVDEVYPSVLNLLFVDKLDSLHIAGRLDADTTGLVLITSDGQWSHKVTSPKKECPKTYFAELADAVDDSLVEQFVQGVELRGDDGGLTKPAQLEIIDSHNVRLTITEGKYHQVKRMFAAVGNKVVQLHRERVGALELGDLEEGEWRYLTDEEVASIR